MYKAQISMKKLRTHFFISLVRAQFIVPYKRVISSVLKIYAKCSLLGMCQMAQLSKLCSRNALVCKNHFVVHCLTPVTVTSVMQAWLAPAMCHVGCSELKRAGRQFCGCCLICEVAVAQINTGGWEWLPGSEIACTSENLACVALNESMKRKL